MYLEAFKAGEDLFANVELQFWRVNPNDGSNEAANVLKQVTTGTVIDPCSGALNPPVSDSESLTPGDETIDVGVNSVAGTGDARQPFDVKDSAGKAVHTGCTFKGSGTYAPTADSGLIAGTLACDGGYTVQCLRPFNNLATTCGGPALSTCGTLGKNCKPYYQLLATCRV